MITATAISIRIVERDGRQDDPLRRRGAAPGIVASDTKDPFPAQQFSECDEARRTLGTLTHAHASYHCTVPVQERTVGSRRVWERLKVETQP
jgi:hypothetical protein